MNVLVYSHVSSTFLVILFVDFVVEVIHDIKSIRQHWLKEAGKSTN